MEKETWYTKWHNNPMHVTVHWFALFIVAGFFLWYAVPEGDTTIIRNTGSNLATSIIVAGGESAFANFQSQIIPGEYIVKFKDNTPDAPGLAKKLVADNKGTLRFTYRSAIKGFSAKLSDQAAEALRRNPNVEIIEQDQTISISGTESPARSWGIDRIDQRSLPLSSTYNYSTTGERVHVYIIDTGIRPTHVEFGGRIGEGFSSIDDEYGPEDCHWHGTHVAGTVSGATVGVAKGVTLHSVRVLSCKGSGTISGAIAGIDWVTANAIKPAVVNMSLGSDYDELFNVAVENSINSGITYVVAAGNSTSDACNNSPGSVATAITVGASTIISSGGGGRNSYDTSATFSNFGRCVDLYAPGTLIVSAYSIDDTTFAGASGTSMAAPHVTGAVALYLQANPEASPAEVARAIISNTTSNALATVGTNSPNLLLYTLDFPTSDAIPPSTPTNLSATAPDYTKINISWGASTDNKGVSGYNIYRENIFRGVSPSNYYTDTNITPGTTYSYMVRAYDYSANESLDSNTVFVTVPKSSIDITSKSVPPKYITSSSVRIVWTTNIPSTGSISFSDGNTDSKTIIDPGTGISHSVTLTGLKSATTYAFQIIAVSSNDSSQQISVSGSFRTKNK